MNAFGIGVFPGPPRLDPAVRHQVAEKPARGLELLPRLGGSRIDEMIAQQVAVGPLLFVPRQTETFESTFESRIEVCFVCGRVGGSHGDDSTGTRIAFRAIARDARWEENHILWARSQPGARQQFIKILRDLHVFENDDARTSAEIKAAASEPDYWLASVHDA